MSSLQKHQLSSSGCGNTHRKDDEKEVVKEITQRLLKLT